MCYIYIIQAEKNIYKIGYATNVEKRFKTIQQNHYKKLKLITKRKFISHEEARCAERFIHKTLRNQKLVLRGEWYKTTLKKIIQLTNILLYDHKKDIIHESCVKELLFLNNVKKILNDELEQKERKEFEKAIIGNYCTIDLYKKAEQKGWISSG